ncbi:MAG: DUF1963 domain-containing protein [Pseudomonadota bacterium]
MTQAEVTPDEIDAKLFRARVPAIAMLRTPQATDPGTPGCWFGGDPTLPAEIPWPYYKPTEREAYGIRYEDPDLTIPMHFLVQINLAYCPRVLGLPLLPKTGTIFVFYDPAVAQATEGIAFTTGTACKVMYVAEDVRYCAHRKPPPMPDLSSTKVFADYRGTSSFNRWPFEFLVVDSYPWETFDVEFGHRHKELRWIEDKALEDHLGTGTVLCRSGITGDRHFIFGASQQAHFPSAESLLKSGVNYLPELTNEHVLLFAFPADQDLGHQTANQIRLEFWITREDLRNRNFDNIVVWEA